MPVKINGATSGSVTLAAPATGSDVTVTLPGTAGTLALAAANKVLQIVRATDTTTRTTSSTSFVDSGLSVTITPLSNTSAILLIWSGYVSSAGASQYIKFQITDSANNAVSGAQSGALGSSGGQTETVMTMFAYATPATTAALTYKLRFLVTGGTGTIANATNTGQLYAIEIAA